MQSMRAVSSAVILLMLTACDVFGPVTYEERIWVSDTGLELSPGEQLAMGYWIQRRDGWLGKGLAREAVWSTEDGSIVSVTRGGWLTALEAGLARVWVEAGGSRDSASVRVGRSATAASAYRSVRVGHHFACADSDEGELYCWGWNYYGQFGNGTRRRFTAVHGPVRASAVPQELMGFDTGHLHVCGLRPGGSAVCWGDGNGQLGDGSYTEYRAEAVQVSWDVPFRQVAAGQYFTCGLDLLDRRVCWGTNSSGQFGNGHSGQLHAAPTAIPGGPVFQELALGGSHACGLTSDGRAYCWGDNYAGQVGADLTTGLVTSPTAVAGTTMFRKLTAGAGHTCGLDSAGKAYCWGGNRLGQLGDGTQAVRALPEPVSTEQEFVDISAGQDHTCALTADGTAHCWGSGLSGQLGTEAALEACSIPLDPVPCSTQPVQVVGPSFRQLDAGDQMTCGVAVDGALYCWGSNWFGALGSGRPSQRSETPSRVVEPFGR